ncbi:cytochrome c oxidase assembly protein [Agrococcus pavilionensis]|uniref:cytochrome c oxidase assembly protein n=1 Tax=Agrococcus pavilionensis TaxID=1346502 RepID=UPI0003909E1F|nr:cytochrome c oxidase assembly protein [Agrococcus pavilionensis]
MPGHGGHSGAVPLAADASWALLDALIVAALLVAVGGYLRALRSARRRGPWPALRTTSWMLGALCAGAATLGPIAIAAPSSLTGHMLAHLLLGMLAPLLLVLGAPVTLLLRALPVTAARRLTRVLRSAPLRVLTHPVSAAVLNAGGLGALYATDLYGLVHASALVHGIVHVHLLLAGYLLTAALVGVDPDPHRASIGVRAAVLLAFMAVHSIIAKRVYGAPPAGVEAADAHVASQLMYYGGDVVDVTLLVLLGLAWLRATRPRRAAVPAAA